MEEAETIHNIDTPNKKTDNCALLMKDTPGKKIRVKKMKHILALWNRDHCGDTLNAQRQTKNKITWSK